TLPLDVRYLLQIVFLCIGSLAARAMILTQVTSGTFENIRPDRVIGVIRTCGIKYLLVCLVYAAAIGVYAAGIVVAGEGMGMLFRLKTIPIALTTIGAGYGVLAGAIFLMHGFCWQLGLLYR